jgi:hypothetical protein
MLIDKLMEAGMPFDEAVIIVTEWNMWQPSILVLKALEFDRIHRVVGFNKELAEELAERGHLAPLEEIPEAEQLEEVKRGAVNYLREKVIPVRAGAQTIAQVSRDIRRELHREPIVRAFIPDALAPYALSFTEFDEEFSVGEEKIYYIKLIDENGEFVEDVPIGLDVWIRDRLMIRG